MSHLAAWSSTLHEQALKLLNEAHPGSSERSVIVLADMTKADCSRIQICAQVAQSSKSFLTDVWLWPLSFLSLHRHLGHFR